MGKINSPWLALITIGLFFMLAGYCTGRWHLFDKPPVKLTWSNANAAKLADAYGLTPDDVSKPVMLWRVEK